MRSAIVTDVVSNFGENPELLAPSLFEKRDEGATGFGALNGILNALGAPVNPQPGPIAAQTNVGLVPGMITDYYNRIFVIPNLIQLQNPAIGQPQPYQIWNAFFQSNLIESINTEAAGGLLNTATVSTPFRALQAIDFSITVTAAASIIIDALFTFNFTVGQGQLRFQATRTTVVPVVPERPIRLQYEWRTDILKSHNGSEQRISTRPKPRLVARYDIILENELLNRRQKRIFFNQLAQPILLPMWNEPFFLTSAAVPSDTQVFGDFTFRDFVTGDFVYLISRDEQFAEIVRVDVATDNSVTFDSVISNNYPVGSSLFPTFIVNIPNASSFSRFPVNVGQLQLIGNKQDLQDLGGRGATLDTFNNQTLLDIVPTNNDVVEEAFSVLYDNIDYGNRFAVYTNQPFPNIAQPRTYFIGSRAELQYWKLFLDTVKGQQETFYTSTFREDLFATAQPIQAGSQITIRDEEDYLNTWFPDSAFKQLVFNTADGDRQFRNVINVIDNQDGTQTITIAPGLTDTPLGSTIESIEFLQHCRLSSDSVEFRHFGTYSEVDITFETVRDT